MHRIPPRHIYLRARRATKPKPKRGRPQRSDAEVEETRQAIVETAKRMIERDGFEATSMRRLAQEAGCAPNTLYAYFASKQALLRAIWSGYFHALFDDLEARAQDISEPRARLRDICQRYVRYWVDHPDRYRMVFMTEGVSQDDVAGFLADTQTLARFALLAEALQQALDPSTSAAALKVRSEALLSSLHGIAHHHVTVSKYPWTAAELLTLTVVDGLLALA